MEISAENFTYKKYRHEPFRHLEFDISTDWIPIQNNLEIIFTNEEQDLPQLYFQTVGKTNELDSSDSFLNFLISQNPKEEYLNIKNIFNMKFMWSAKMSIISETMKP